MSDPLADQDRAAAREAGIQAAIYYRELRRTMQWWLAARLMLAYATGEERGSVVVTVEDD